MSHNTDASTNQTIRQGEWTATGTVDAVTLSGGDIEYLFSKKASGEWHFEERGSHFEGTVEELVEDLGSAIADSHLDAPLNELIQVGERCILYGAVIPV